MENGKTRVIAPGFDWSKVSLAREAGVNINTVVRKISDGGWAFPDVNDRFDKLKRERSRSVTAFDAKTQVVVELRCEVEKLRKENRRLALEVNRIGRQVLDERDRADRMNEYERQNTSLREEINRIRLVRPTKATGKRL
jgi:predicted nuclease with TOPRIM domain